MESYSCNSKNYHGQDLPQMDGDYIQVRIDTDQRLRTILPQDLIESAREIASKDPLPVVRLIAYFDLGNSENEYVIRLKYSLAAWNKALEDDQAMSLKRPRVFYLVWKEDQWAESWVEFEDGVTFTSPGHDDRYGYVCIQVDTLEDPLIGGC